LRFFGRARRRAANPRAARAAPAEQAGTGNNSPYTTAFLKHIEKQEEIGAIFRDISEDVYETTKREQLPELSLSMIGRFYLRGKGSEDGGPSTSAQNAAGQDAAAYAWTATKETSNIAVLEEFVRRYGDSFYASLAQARIEELKKAQVTAVAPSKPLPIGDAVSIDELRAPSGRSCRQVVFDATSPVHVPVAMTDAHTFAPTAYDTTLCGLSFRSRDPRATSLIVSQSLKAVTVAPAPAPGSGEIFYLRDQGQQKNVVYTVQVFAIEGSSRKLQGTLRHALVP
jgi:hypothetical protein